MNVVQTYVHLVEGCGLKLVLIITTSQIINILTKHNISEQDANEFITKYCKFGDSHTNNPTTSTNASNICLCKTYILRNNIPPTNLANGLEFPEIPLCLCSLCLCSFIKLFILK